MESQQPRVKIVFATRNFNVENIGKIPQGERLMVHFEERNRSQRPKRKETRPVRRRRNDGARRRDEYDEWLDESDSEDSEEEEGGSGSEESESESVRRAPDSSNSRERRQPSMEPSLDSQREMETGGGVLHVVTMTYEGIQGQLTLRKGDTVKVLESGTYCSVVELVRTADRTLRRHGIGERGEFPNSYLQRKSGYTPVPLRNRPQNSGGPSSSATFPEAKKYAVSKLGMFKLENGAVLDQGQIYLVLEEGHLDVRIYDESTQVDFLIPQRLVHIGTRSECQKVGKQTLREKVELMASQRKREEKEKIMKKIKVDNCRSEIVKLKSHIDAMKKKLKAKQEELKKLTKVEEGAERMNEEDNTPDGESLVCGICADRQITFTLIPCGHTFCKDCVRKIGNKCSYCRTTYTKRMKIFI